MGVLIILVLLFIIGIEAIIASKFNEIAGEKGYSGYFSWCFWLGVVGWCMVIALPDKKARGNYNTQSNNSYNNTQGSGAPDDELPQL